MLVFRISFISPLGFEPVTLGIKAPIQYGTILNKNHKEKLGSCTKKRARGRLKSEVNTYHPSLNPEVKDGGAYL
jgi:hypothetical protein